MSITAASLNVRFGTEGVAQTKRAIDDVGGAVDKADQKRKALGVGFGSLAGIIGGVFLGATQQSIGFGEQMANVNSIAQLSTDQISALGDEVLELSTKTGQGPEVLAQGLYDIYSSGFQGAEGLYILEQASLAANAGLSTTAVTGRAITGVLNAYGLSAEDAGHISDVMFQTVNDGGITFDQLANNMGNTTSQAAALGISFEQLAAGYAVMTLNNVNASAAETQLSALMRSAVNPTEAMTKAVQAYGYESAQALLAAEGLPGFLNVLTEASGGSTEALFDLLGTTEATNAALILGADNAAAYNAEVVKMEESSAGLGATQKALDKQMESTAFSLRLLKTNIQAAAIAIGVQFEPVIRVVAKAMTAMIKVFLGISKPVQAVIAGIVGLVGVLAAGAGAWILFGSTIAAIGSILATVALPILAVVAAVAALYVAWDRNIGGIRDITESALGGIADLFEPVLDFLGRLKTAWEDLAPPVYQWGDTVADIVEPMGLAERALTALDIASGGLITRLREMTAIDLAGWARDRVVDLGDWTLDVAIPNIAAFTWDIVTLITDALPENIIVPLTDWIARLDGAEVVAGAINLAGDIYDWVVANPIGAIAISAAALSFVFFGIPGIAFLFIGGLAVLIAAAMLGEIPDEVIVPAIDLVIALAGFTVELENFAAEVFIEVGLRAAEIEADWDAFWSVFTLSDITIAAPDIEVDWGSFVPGFLKGIDNTFGPGSPVDRGINGITGLILPSLQLMAEGFGNMFGPGSPVDNAINGAFSGIANIVGAAAAPFIDSLQTTWDDITGARDTFKGLFDSLSIPDIDLSMPDINWPDLPDVWSIPFLADFIGMLLDLRNELGSTDWTIDIGMPDINWPGTDDLLALVPGDVLAFIKDPWGWVQSHAGGGPGGGPTGGGGGGGKGKMELESRYGGNQLASLGGLGGSMSIQIDTSGAVASLGLLKAAMTEAQAVSTTLKDAIASIGSSSAGARGAAGGGGAGGGGMFSELTTSLQNLVTTAQATALAMGLAGLAVGQAFGRSLSTGISGSSGIVSAAVGTLVAVAQGNALRMAFAGLSVGQAFGRATVTGITGQRGAVGAAVGGYVSAASGYIFQMFGVGVSVGAALGRGVAAGIRSQIGSVAAAAAALVSAAMGAARATGGIKSPSTIMRDEVGKMLGLGAIIGVQSMIPDMMRTMADLVAIPSIAPDTANRSLAMNGGYSGGTVPLTARGQGTQTIHIGSINVPTTIHIPENVSDAQVLRIIRINAAAVEHAARSALNAQGGRS